VKVTREGGGYVARVTGPQGSGVLTSMAQSNGLAVIPEEVKEARAGDTVRVLMPDWNEEQS
ncbi:MAG: molybdopterin molybdenumtransferase MoeA, partial [Chloroflexota bacterium]